VGYFRIQNLILWTNTPSVFFDISRGYLFIRVWTPISAPPPFFPSKSSVKYLWVGRGGGRFSRQPSFLISNENFSIFEFAFDRVVGCFKIQKIISKTKAPSTFFDFLLGEHFIRVCMPTHPPPFFPFPVIPPWVSIQGRGGGTHSNSNLNFSYGNEIFWFSEKYKVVGSFWMDLLIPRTKFPSVFFDFSAYLYHKSHFNSTTPPPPPFLAGSRGAVSCKPRLLWAL
jgi:hypothetical protein